MPPQNRPDTLPADAPEAIRQGESATPGQIQRLLASQNRILTLIARSAPLTVILSRLALEIESLAGDILASILVLEESGRELRHGAAPSLPMDYLKAIERVPVGAGIGACGESAFCGKEVICRNLATDPNWQGYPAIRDLALRGGLRACWSFPILDAGGRVLGTFALYAQKPSAPGAWHRTLIDHATHLATLAIERHRRETELGYLRQGLEQNPIGVLLFERTGTIRYANPAVLRLMSCSGDELRRRGAHRLFCPEPDGDALEDMERALDRAAPWRGELRLQAAQEVPVPVEVTLSPLAHSDPPLFLALCQDIRERKATATELERLAFFDPVTALPNRALLRDRLSMTLAAARREKHHAALLFIDLDHFKQINDIHGHNFGDILLRRVADRLGGLLRGEDTLARLGGDEFVALLPGLAQERKHAAYKARHVAEKLLTTLREPFEIRGHSCQIGASIGITLFPRKLESAEDLLREADTAMYRAKAAGRGSAVLFEPAMHRALAEHYRTERELRKALAETRFEVYLQPQVDRGTRICAAEALVRWHHPIHGVIPSARFIPVAEESGLIVPMGEWVLTEVCRLLARLRQAARPLPIAVNISPHQFRRPAFISRLQSLLADSGADPSLLILEITENLLMEDPEAVARQIGELARLEIQFSIDDFGTGYSSLAYLKRLPVAEIKIDRSFVRDLLTEPGDAAIVQAILAMTSHLDLRVVAEGVEFPGQAEFLTSHGCQRLQGYLFGHPRPAARFLDAWLGGATRTDQKALWEQQGN